MFSQYKSNLQNVFPPGTAPPGTGPPMDSDSDAINLAFLISLSVTFAIVMILLIMVVAYITFCSGSDESQYDEETGVRRPRDIGDRRLPLSGLFSKRHNDYLLDASFTQSSAYGMGRDGDEEEEEEAFKRTETEELKKMSAFEIELYERAKEFERQNPPAITRFGSFISDNDLIFLKDRGIQSYFLLPSINDNVDKIGHFLPSFLIMDKLDISFTRFNKSSSTILNYPLPYNKRDAVYFEVKVFKHSKDSNSVFSIGLTTVPYPYFRPPGMSNFSIGYESSGKLRINNPFSAATLLPRLEEGDVVGFGYRYKTGTIFITHNGKKLMDITQNVHIDLFLSIGCMNASYTRTYTLEGLLEDPDNVDISTAIDSGMGINETLREVHDIHVEDIDSDVVELNLNLGQLGYVFIEANVKKYSFGSVFGDIGIPPSYPGINNGNKDVVLQKGEELPPQYISDGDTNNDDNDADTDILEGTSEMLQEDMTETTPLLRCSSDKPTTRKKKRTKKHKRRRGNR